MKYPQKDPDILRSHIRQIASALGDLYLTITTISGEFEAEETQPQVIASLNSIARCVGFIQRFALCTLDFEQVDDEEENGHE
ncbi:MAG: hypothetical protein PUF31_04180 [Oscillospiraceae bacterium]|nr:hypothetical protein [Oscillospiraceae bacterium]